ncbi:MAG: hypothetical protein JWM80_4372, partial [Cyanobacteria bacterium RYN_339]|nr:hypothetical protein [Cyanobacteria bacterium RYN_339]
MSAQVLAHRYHLRRPLGQGGMGLVWLAEDTLQGGDVALKVLTEQLATNQASVLQVKQEFRLMTQLRHANCCEVYDYGFLADGQPYFTMEVVPGDGLDHLLPLTPARFRPLFVQLLQALAYVHQRGYVHCDLKSENVRVRPDGTLKLMDFGLMVNAGSANLPIRGTLGYLPPEVIMRGAIDQRTDLYAAGCLAFEALVGELPFVRPRPLEVLQAHLKDAPPFRGRLLDDEGRDWAPIIAKLLAKDPVARYQAAEDVLEALGEQVGNSTGGALLTSQLVGREAELAVLQAGLDAVKRGEPGGAIALVGPEGAGKSRLLAELKIRAQLEHVPQGLGTCHRLGGSPLGVVATALRAVLPALRAAAPELVAEQAPALAALLPELGGEPAPELDSPDKEKARLFGALAALFDGLATAGGLVLAFEDWQWADSLSVEFLSYLLRNGGELPLLVLLSMQAATPQAPWSHFVTWLAVDGLDAVAGARMLGSMLGTDQVPDAFLAKMMALSGGNPQILEGALAHLVQTLVLKRAARAWQFTVDWDEGLLPVNRRGLLHRRLGFLADDAQGLARVVAVLGNATDLAELQGLSGLAEEALFAALEQLLEHQVLARDEAGRYVLAHDALAALLLEQLDPAERCRLHAAALAGLEADAPAQPPLELLTQLARHALGAADRPKAIRYALEAGKRSTMIYANEEAARLLEIGMALASEAGDPSLVDYLRFLADVYRVTGRYDEALPLYQEAVALAEAAGDALALGRLLASLAKLHMVRDQLEEALAEARRAQAASLGLAPGPVTLRALLTEVRALFYLGRTAEAMQRADEALAGARRLEQSTLIAQALALRGYLEVASPEPDVRHGVHLLQEATARFAEVGDRLGLYNATNLLGNALMGMGDYHEAWQAFEGTRQLAFELGAKDDETFAWLNLAHAAYELGRVPESREAARRARELAEALQSKFTIGLATAMEASARALGGDAAGVEADFTAALALAHGIKSQYLEVLVRQHQVETLLHLGAFEDALAAVQGWQATKQASGNTEGAARTAALEGAALLGLGREPEAAEALARALAAAVATHAKGDEALARTGLAALALHAGRHDEATGHAEAALPLARRIGAKLVAAELHGVLGEVALATGKAAEPHFEAMQALA